MEIRKETEGKSGNRPNGQKGYLSKKICTFFKLACLLNYTSLILMLCLAVYELIQQHKLLEFLRGHQNAADFFFASARQGMERW
ncbi:MAG TPA: hypothetical protein H9782_01880 [Candidatus Bariatricus faecipullorum]|nr:hypothetical protein [Candidatus Bariatricus faecipullorum]